MSFQDISDVTGLLLKKFETIKKKMTLYLGHFFYT